MGKKVKLFVFSDVHGHADTLYCALTAAGYDPHDRRHILVDCGDNFDRGPQNAEMYRFVRRLPHRSILLCGNHEEMLADLLSGGTDFGRYEANGALQTAAELLGVSPDSLVRAPERTARRVRARRIVRRIGRMREFFEAKHYVFVHGWLPTVTDGSGQRCIPSDWRSATPEMWAHARWDSWVDAWEKGLVLPDKTVVCGHRECAQGHRRFSGEACDAPFYGAGVIAIDACTVRSGTVNVLVLEDELL